MSAVLHMDEETPHLHVSLVPVVQGESKETGDTKKRLAKDKEMAAAEERRHRKRRDATRRRRTHRHCGFAPTT